MKRTALRMRAALSLALVAFGLATASVCPAADYVILVDCTGTMRYQGRAEAALEAVRDFMGSTSPGDFITVYGYGEEPYPALPEYPARVDCDYSGLAISEGVSLSFGADRTDITRGLELVWEERELVLPRALETARAEEAAGSCVILLTDGKLIPCYDDYSEYDRVYARSRARLLELGELLGEAGVPVHAIGLGPADKIDGALLEDVAWKSGGDYVHSPTSADLGRAFRELAPAVTAGRGSTSAAGTVGSVVEASTVGGSESDYEHAQKPVEALSFIQDEAAASSAATGSEPAPEGAMGARGVPAELGVAAAGGGPRATTPKRSSPGVNAARAAFRDFAGTVQETIVGVLGVIVGFVAIGVQRRQSWTHAFTRPLLRREIRVKGYLKPSYPDGVVGARSCIPLENPGVPVLEVGEGAEFGDDIPGTLVEFIGTVDGSPPTLKVVRGAVLVNGQPVEEEQALGDGDLIELAERPYMYLRGSRR